MNKKINKNILRMLFLALMLGVGTPAGAKTPESNGVERTINWPLFFSGVALMICSVNLLILGIRQLQGSRRYEQDDKLLKQIYTDMPLSPDNDLFFKEFCSQDVYEMITHDAFAMKMNPDDLKNYINAAGGVVPANVIDLYTRIYNDFNKKNKVR